jgi:protein-S-isoprenylcysteine O-methyltransferase Ste14
MQPATGKPPLVTLRLGRFSLTGIPAVAVTLLLLAGITTLVVYSRPRLTSVASFALWAIMIAFWSVPAKQAAAIRSTESLASRQRHQYLLISALLFTFIPVPGLTGWFLPPVLSVALVGLSLQTASMLLYGWARQHLGDLWSGTVTILADHRVVGSGPYRLLRHPMYTAVLGMYAGAAIASGQVHALLGFGLATLAYARKIRIEERALGESLGDAYRVYRRKTWALVPWVF